MLDFERFYFNTKNFLYQYLYQHVCDFFETEDIAQEAYLTALEEWDELQKHQTLWDGCCRLQKTYARDIIDMCFIEQKA